MFQSDKLAFSVGGIVIQGLATHYATNVEGSFVALINSWGLLEIAVCQGSAQEHCGARIGDKIEASVFLAAARG
jgi:S-adenosylmethionine hydrolase